MRHVPEGIDGVAVKAATQMIVDSARRHLAKGKEIHLEGLFAARGFGCPRIQASQKIQRYRAREFWRHTETAFVGVVAPRDLLIGRIQGRGTKLDRLFFAS